MSMPRTVIEIVGTNKTGSVPPLAHIAREVHVNGAPVLLAQDGIYIEYDKSGSGEPTKVTLEILPTEIHFITKP